MYIYIYIYRAPVHRSHVSAALRLLRPPFWHCLCRGCSAKSSGLSF